MKNNLMEKKKKNVENEYVEKKLNAEQMNIIGELFHSLDNELSGELDVKECLILFRLLAIPIDNEKEFQSLLNEVDFDNNGKISLEEFSLLLSKKINESEMIDMNEEIFSYFDRDEDGIINLNDLSQIFVSLGKKFSLDYFKEMLKEIDYDKDGFVTRKDFDQMKEKDFS